MLSGNVRYSDASSASALTSNTLSFNRSTGETVATGNVKATYTQQKTQAPGAMLSPTQPVHVTAEQMMQRNSAGTARFSGAARLWQGGNMVEAPEIDFNRNERVMDAQAQGQHRVSTVFVQGDNNGKAAPVDVRSDHLHYADVQREATFEGSIVLRSAGSMLRADRAELFLRSGMSVPPAVADRSALQTSHPHPSDTANRMDDGAAPRSDKGDAPSQVQRIDASGHIVLQQPGRKAVGSHLVYTAENEKFVLTGDPGSPPSIFDAEHGQVTGVSLTFFNGDGRVLVDSSNSASISPTRLHK
jgi:lipopolysaccharide export system protein LptA